MTHDYCVGPQVVASGILDDVNAERLGPIVSPAQSGKTRKRPAGDFPLKQVSTLCI